MKKIILACLLIPFMFSTVNAEEKIGQVNKVQTYAYGERVDQEREPLFARDEVYKDQIVETVKSGALWIIFNDDTELFMDESGSLTLDHFVFDTVGSADSMVISLAKGLFRFITGNIAPQSVIITTPISTIGIRGTDVEISIDDTGAMRATAFEGSISIRTSSIRSSGPIDMAAYTEGCQSILIAKDGTILGVEPCPPGGPSIGPATFASASGHGGGHQNSPPNPGNDSGDPSGNDSSGPSGGDSGGPGEGPEDSPSGGSGNGNGNNGNPGNGGGNINGSGPGTGNNGQNNGRGHGADNGGGGHGNGGHK